MANRKNKRVQKQLTNAAKELAKANSGKIIFIAILLVIVIAVGFGIYWFYLRQPKRTYNNGEIIVQAYPTVGDQDISIHFLELGNHYAGDCVYIKTSDCDILIDCGSRVNSLPTIKDYLSHYVTDGVFEYVILTHAHQDHIAGFGVANYDNSFFGAYSVEIFIDSATYADTAIYNRFVTNLDKAVTQHGTTHYTALQCVNGTDGAQSSYAIGGGYTMKILDSYYYENPAPYTDENNNSVCCLISNGTRNYLLTGDLEQEGEAKLIERNNLPHVDLFKAGHHGSYTASSPALMSVIQPKTVVVCCCAGDDEYTSTTANQFPSQTFINNVSPYTSEIFVTTLNDESVEGKHLPFNGNVVYMSKGNNYVVACSYSSTILKESEWFKLYRTW